MFLLDPTYGFKAWDQFRRIPFDQSTETLYLGTARSGPIEAFNNPIDVQNYPELVSVVSFLAAMNKRHTLFFRGQGAHVDPQPSLARDRWAPGNDIFPEPFALFPGAGTLLRSHLNCHIVRAVQEFCLEFAIPRPNTLKQFREAVWAIIQHYGLWPTPLIDITSSLRVAASFALWGEREQGYLFVVAMVASTNSITFDSDQHIVLARLQAVCPPLVQRPHLQDGFLAGRFPDKALTGELGNRVVAVIRLGASRSFWTKDFPPISEEALLPTGDEFSRRLHKKFGPESTNSLMAEMHKVLSGTSD